jgi:hypothetical protein
MAFKSYDLKLWLIFFPFGYHLGLLLLPVQNHHATVLNTFLSQMLNAFRLSGSLYFCSTQCLYILRKLRFFVPFLLLRLTVAAQPDCSDVLEYPAGRIWVYQWYGANQKPSYQTWHQVPPQQEGREADRVELTILNSFQDTVYQGNYYVQCTADGLQQDLLSKLTPDMLQSLAGLELRTTESGWLLPNGVTPGDSIPQSYSHVSGYSGDNKIIDLDLAIGPVLILEQENLSTPAGGFPCVAMAYELWVTQLTRKRFRLRDWFSTGVGIIRREVFDRRGHFFGYCELVYFSDNS